MTKMRNRGLIQLGIVVLLECRWHLAVSLLSNKAISLNSSLMNNNYIGVDLDLFRQPKIQRLELKHGKGAVAIYLQLCLKLAEQGGNFLVEDIPILSREFFVKEDQLKEIINFPDLFIFKDNYFYCDWVKIKVLASQEKSKKARKAILKRWSNNKSNTDVYTDVLQTNNGSNTIKENKRKEKEINKNKENINSLEKKVNEILENQIFKLNQHTKFPELSEEIIKVTLLTALNENPKLTVSSAINWLVNENKNKRQINNNLERTQANMANKFKNPDIIL